MGFDNCFALRRWQLTSHLQLVPRSCINIVFKDVIKKLILFYIFSSKKIQGIVGIDYA
jgi:hypothetical protein